MAAIDVSGAVTALSTVVSSVGLVGAASLGVDAAAKAVGWCKQALGVPAADYGDWAPASEAEMA